MKKVLTLVVLAAVIVTTIVFNVKTVIQNKNNTAAAVDIRSKDISTEEYDASIFPEGTIGRGCMKTNACNYDMFATKPDTCVFAWYAGKTKNSEPRLGTVLPEVKKNMVCSARNKCSESLMLKVNMVYYDDAGNVTYTANLDPIMHSFVTLDTLKKYKGTNACASYYKVNPDDIRNAVMGDPGLDPKQKNERLR